MLNDNSLFSSRDSLLRPLRPRPRLLRQCDLLIRESFRPGLRPHGNNGRERLAEIHDTLKDYWPQVPSNGTMWISSDQSGVPTWGFAGSSLDPAEVDPLDPYNGTAFGDASAAAVLPFLPPSEAFTTSAEVVQLFGSTSATYIGFTSAPTLINNFETSGALWMSLNGSGQWTIRANGNNIIASGTAPIVGTLASGWEHVEFTFDPVTSMVSGRVMNTQVAPVHVSLTTPILYFGFEAHESWNVVNNISLFKGASLQVNVQGPASAQLGGSATFIATTNAADPSIIAWSHDGVLLSDGAQPSGVIISGAQTPTLNLVGLTQSDSGSYTCTIANSCGMQSSAPANLNFCAADFNSDSTVDFFDYLDFVDAFSSNLAAADFNRDSVIDFFDYLDFVDTFSIGC